MTVDQDFETVRRGIALNRFDTTNAALRRIREEWEDTAESNRVWQEVAQEVCAATGATVLVHVPATFDALRAENALLRHAAEQVKNPEYVKALDQAGVEYVEQLVAEVERLREALAALQPDQGDE